MHTFNQSEQDPNLGSQRVGEMLDAKSPGRPGSAAVPPSAGLLDLFGQHRLTPTQRRIARCLTERAGEAAFLSSSELAVLAGVSQPSVTRFAVALGFTGYPDLRRRMRSLALGRTGETAEEARRNELQHAVAEEVTNLTGLEGLLEDRATINHASELLSLSTPLPVLGLRASGGLATYFGFFAAKVHDDVRVLTEGGTHTVDRLEQAAASGATGLLAFVLPRYPQESIQLLKKAQALGLHTVTITDTEFAPVQDVSEVVLPASVGSRLVFDSQAAPMLLAMILLQGMCDLDPKSAQARLEAFERSAAERRIFTA
jgi:DNA-binding MurR/RpiR family transcriptional regulator